MPADITPTSKSDSTRPRVVALVPAWNAEDFIMETLDSLVAQTYSNVRILISNDASTDQTGTICNKYEAEDPRFTVIHQKNNLGWIGNVNALFAAASGDYYFFAFHDDLIAPDYVSALVKAMEKDKEAALAFTDMELVRIDGATSYPVLNEFDNSTGLVDRLRMMASKPRYNWVPNRGLFRASAPERLGGLRRNLAGEFVADWPWLLSLLTLGHFIRVPGIRVKKHYKQESVSVKWRYSPWQRAAVVLSACGVIRRADLSTSERWSIYFLLVRSYPLHVWGWIRRILSQQPQLRRMYFMLKRVN